MAANATHVLLEDPDLGEGLPGARLATAERDLVAPVRHLSPGSWVPADDAEPARGGVGLLVLDGLLVRRVGQEGRYGGELLGAGDLLRPWEHDGEDALLPFEVTWRVIEPTRIAVLGPRFTARAGAYPEVTAALVGRAMRRARTLSVNMAIVHHFRLERRLVLLLWHLAERWGKVAPGGVILDLPITQELLADLCGAHRPSVTVALRGLQERAAVTRSGHAWILHGDAPAKFEDLLSAPVESSS